jgi:hypothetical protein
VKVVSYRRSLRQLAARRPLRDFLDDPRVAIGVLDGNVGAVAPKNDLPETAFDETDAPTIQTILTIKATSFQQCIPSRATSVPVTFA